MFRVLAVLDLLRAAADDFFLKRYRLVKSLWPAGVARLGAGFSLLSSLLYRPRFFLFAGFFFLFCFPLCGAAAIVTPRFEFRFSAACVPAIATAAAGSPLAVVAALLSRAAFRRNMRRSLAVWFDICSDGFRLHSFACVAYSYFW